MGNFTLLHPWLLSGLAAASLPVLIHLIGQKRAPTIQFAAFDFLVAINQRLAKREKLRQILLLLLRTLAIAALVLAVARPMPQQHAAFNTAARRLALVIDASGSMNYQRNGKSLLENAQKMARDMVSHLQPGDAVTLVIAGDSAHAPFQTPSFDHSAVRSAIAAVKASSGVADIGAALDLAVAQLGTSGAGTSIVVFSDMSQNSFSKIRPTAMDPPPDVRLVDVAERDAVVALPNVAVEQVSIEHDGASPSERQFKVRLRNYGTLEVKERPVELVIDNSVVLRGYVTVPAQGSIEKILTHSFAQPGIYHGAVQLGADDADGYDRDDRASFVLDVAAGVRVLAINGDPRTNPMDDELFFFEKALQAIPKGDAPINLTLLTPDEFTSTLADLADTQVIVLANVGQLSAAQVGVLRDFVARGGGLMIALGDRIQFEATNEQLATLLPHPLRDMHQVADPVEGRPAIGIGEVDFSHAIVAGLGLAGEESLRTSRTARYFNLDVGATLKARPVLRFDNGAPALIEGRGPEGVGRLLLLTTSIDRDLSDLALRSAFPALMQRAIRYLAHSVENEAPKEIRLGSPVELAVPTGGTKVALISPSGERHEVDVDAARSMRVNFADIKEVGIQKAEVYYQTKWKAEPRLDVPVNASLEESDFAPIAASTVAQALGQKEDDAPIDVAMGKSDDLDPFEARGLAPYLLIALCCLFIGESALAARG